MLKNKNIICISSIDWDFIWQGHQEIMSTLAGNGNKVLFVENTGVRPPGIKDISRIKNRLRNWLRGVRGIRKEIENLYVFSPLVLPFPYSKFARFINRHLILPVLDKWMKVMDFSDPIVWTFLPTPLSIDIADSIIKRLFIYYCIDNFSVSSASAKKIKISEKKLLKKVDLIFATSKELCNYCSMHNDKVYRFPFAVNFKEFEKASIKETSMPEEFKNIKTPIIGYVGGVHKWINQDLIKYLAEKCPQYSFVFIGPIQADMSKLQVLKNIYFFGKKEHDRLPYYIKHFDVGAIPYIITEYTNNVYPTKLNEYLSLGKPVVSTSLPEVIGFNKEYGDIVQVAEDSDMFKECIEKAIAEDNQSLKDRRIEVARKNSWENQIEKMSQLIETEIEIKKIDREARWREHLVALYRTARRRILRLAIAGIFVYILIFKTSFFWFLASPLKVSNVPQRSDAIVVFGGGVGETGSPGKSTIERARYAAELYKAGYANKIIFSSGYVYTYNDAENMKLFASSMGVPETDIILEKSANSTYENVKFSKEILDSKKWDSIILVSASYNMKRAELVFYKWARGIKVTYMPVQKNQFYDRSQGIRLEQIKAILHEYGGIIYYWIKGYI